MDESVIMFALAVGLAYVYAFVGGFTDAANAIATSVGSRVLTPLAAVAIAGVFNLIGGLTGTKVAETIGKGLLDPSALNISTVVAGIAGAMTWSLITYFFGIPVSETHGLIGGLIGAGMATAGVDVVNWTSLTKVGIAIIASPVLGLLGGMLLYVAIVWTCRNVRRGLALPWFVHLQRLSAIFMAYSHGRNDAQKPMGVLALAIALYYGAPKVSVPTWIIVSCASVAAIGTALGGWRIIKTLGMGLTELKPSQGFAAEVAGASVIQVASGMGIPISTTHAITSSIVGVGLTQRTSAIRWNIAAHIFASWILTVPVTVGLGALYVLLLSPFR